MVDQTRELYLFVPENILRQICRERKIPLKSFRKLRIVNELTKQLNSEDVSKLIEQYRYGGRGSISWFKPTSTDENPNLSNKIIIEKLIKYCGKDPFKEELRPELDSHPKIVSGKILPNGNLLLQMAHVEIRPQLHGFSITEEEETAFSQFIIRRGSLFFEARAARQKSKEMAIQVSQALDYTDIGQITLSDAELHSLIQVLDAYTISAKHKHVSGDFDTTEVVVSPQKHDLETSNDYQNTLGTLENRRKRLGFCCNTNDRTIETKMEVYPKSGAMVFRSFVDERVIDHVFQSIKQVKGF